MAAVWESLEGKKKGGNPPETVEYKKYISYADFQTFKMLLYSACGLSANKNAVFYNLNCQHWRKTM